MRSKRFHNWNTPRRLFFFLLFPHTLSLPLSSYLLYLAAQREKLSAAESSFPAAAASRELISVFDWARIFPSTESSFLSFIAYLFQARESKTTNVECNCSMWSAFEWRNQCGVNKIRTIQSVESVRVQLNQRLCCDFTKI